MKDRRQPLFGAASCALFVIAVAAFAYWWARFGMVPVKRGWHSVGTFTPFLEAWTRIFAGAALAGSVAGAIGTRRRGEDRPLARTGLLLNLLALAALFVLTRTGSN